MTKLETDLLRQARAQGHCQKPRRNCAECVRLFGPYFHGDAMELGCTPAGYVHAATLPELRLVLRRAETCKHFERVTDD